MPAYYHSPALTPFENIALEDALLDQDGDDITLLFWRSRRAVVMGKNQNPWREVNLVYCREHDITLARRFSGGGSVYQDEGNLNYAVILPRAEYAMETILGHIAESFQAAGISVEPFMQNSLGIHGKKFSGHAFCYRKNRVLHHGTLLLDAHLDHLERSLTPDSLDLTSHAVPSRPASVMNLSDVGLDSDAVKSIILRGVEQAAHVTFPSTPENLPDLEVSPKFASLDWIWGQTPAFSLEDGRVSIRIRKMRIEVIRGVPEADHLIGMSLLDEDVRHKIDALPDVLRTLLAPFKISFD